MNEKKKGKEVQDQANPEGHEPRTPRAVVGPAAHETTVYGVAGFLLVSVLGLARWLISALGVNQHANLGQLVYLLQS